jgi:hypothetical protein
MKPGLYCGNGELQSARYLFVRQALQIAENDDAAVKGFQSVQSGLNDPLHFLLGITPIETIGPVDYRTLTMVTIVSKLGQVLLVLDLSFLVLTAADFS